MALLDEHIFIKTISSKNRLDEKANCKEQSTTQGRLQWQNYERGKDKFSISKQHLVCNIFHLDGNM